MSGNFAFNVSRALGAHLTTTAETSIYIATQYMQVVNIRIANIGTAQAAITVKWYDSTGTASYCLLKSTPILPGDAIQIAFEAFGMVKNDEIRLTADTANAFDVVMTVIEMPGRSG